MPARKHDKPIETFKGWTSRVLGRKPSDVIVLVGESPAPNTRMSTLASDEMGVVVKSLLNAHAEAERRQALSESREYRQVLSIQEKTQQKLDAIEAELAVTQKALHKASVSRDKGDERVAVEKLDECVEAFIATRRGTLHKQVLKVLQQFLDGLRESDSLSENVEKLLAFLDMTRKTQEREEAYGTGALQDLEVLRGQLRD